MNIRFEHASFDDAPALTEIQIRAFDDDARRFGNQPDGGPPGYDSVDAQCDLMRTARAYFKIIMDDQTVGGLVVFEHPEANLFELSHLYIDPNFQDRGIGTQAMNLMETTFPDATRWMLHTPQWATRNHHFYEKLGYNKVAEETQEDGFVLFRYEKA